MATRELTCILYTDPLSEGAAVAQHPCSNTGTSRFAMFMQAKYVFLHVCLVLFVHTSVHK